VLFNPVDYLCPSALVANPTTLERAIKHYGLTESWQSAGYILPDGTLLDFSEGGGEGRSQDHRNVEFLVQKKFEYRTDAMNHFMKLTGAIRFMPEAISFDVMTEPTRAQMLVMQEIAREEQHAQLEMQKPGAERFYREYDEWELSHMLLDIERYW
jgi:quinol monooxygenase YgiN